MLEKIHQTSSHLTNLGGVVGGTKNEFWCAVVSGTNVGHVRLILDQDFGTAEITKLQNTRAGIKKEILRLDVAMAYALRVNVCQ